MIAHFMTSSGTTRLNLRSQHLLTIRLTLPRAVVAAPSNRPLYSANDRKMPGFDDAQAAPTTGTTISIVIWLRPSPPVATRSHGASRSQRALSRAHPNAHKPRSKQPS